MATVQARRVDLFGEVEPLTKAQAEAEAVAHMTRYRQAVQEAVAAGRGIDAAHGEALPWLQRARSALRREGWAESAVRALVAREWHG